MIKTDEAAKKYASTGFKRINKKPLTRHSAKGYGAAAVDNTAARSFYIKPSTLKGEPQRKPHSYDPLKFRAPLKGSKMKHPIHIEKTRYAIDTKGERTGITAKGWAAQQNKKRRKL